MKTTKATNPKIVSIEDIDFNDSEQITYSITLDNGEVIKAWTGKPCYSLPDEAVGVIEIGAELVHIGESYCPAKNETSKVFEFNHS